MRTMQRAGAVLVLLTLAATLLSCSRGPAGTYTNSKDSGVTLELKNDGNFAILEKGTSAATGTYKVQGTVITFVLAGNSNKTGTGKLEGDVLTDPDGTTWNKQK